MAGTPLRVLAFQPVFVHLRTLTRDPELRFRGLRNDLLLVKVALVRIASFPDSEAEYRLLIAEIRQGDACMTKWGGAR